MSPGRLKGEMAVSAAVSTILMVVLVIGIAMIIWSVWIGSPSILHDKVYIAGEAKAIVVNQPGGIPMQVVGFTIREAEPFHFAGQAPPIAGKEVLLKVITPDGRTLYPTPFISGGALEGRTLFIYPNSTGYSEHCDYIVSDSPPAGKLKPFVLGTWTVQLIDTEAHLLISSDDRAKITEGTSSYALAGGTPGGNVWRTDCTPLGYTVQGNPVAGHTGPPMNMSYLTFDGNDWLEYQDDPTLKYTGDLTISLWLRPLHVNTWKQVIGKGLQTPSGSGVIEDKNYDLYLINRKVYFEWDDRVTNTHYHIMTNNDVVTAGNWQYVNLVIEGGEPKIYVNGVSQAFSYYISNVPGNNLTSQIPEVRLKDNQYPLTMGKQASQQYPFPYSGDIGSFALYNRGLTTDEIFENLQTYSA
ncbi:MAG TPA: LamG domain-containing protein [Methanolinea sp.]|nr:LamG domain-containing protein [Methanolinea sp.]HQJ39915.1 LamG domain-containing protein [Methanoregulaceae archaeon]